MDPLLQWPTKFCATVTVAVYVVSVITGNVSQVDRLWTFLPTIYTGYYALLPLWPSEPYLGVFPYTPKEGSLSASKDFSPRALMIFSMVVLWMFRLSYNTWRRGLFKLKEEDYRWEVLRKRMSPLLFQLFNAVFIAGIQNVILLLLGMPAYHAVKQEHMGLGMKDYVLGVVGVVTLMVEFVADNQQYSFQEFKRSGVLKKNEWYGARIDWKEEDRKRGFVSKGLWGWCRHPNFLCEQMFWMIVTVISSRWIVDLTPGIVLCMLFQGSTTFTEQITTDKYEKGYKEYKRKVYKFIPWLPSRDK